MRFSVSNVGDAIDRVSSLDCSLDYSAFVPTQLQLESLKALVIGPKKAQFSHISSDVFECHIRGGGARRRKAPNLPVSIRWSEGHQSRDCVSYPSTPPLKSPGVLGSACCSLYGLLSTLFGTNNETVRFECCRTGISGWGCYLVLVSA